MSPADVKNAPIVVSTREVEFFQKNYPVHHTVLMELVKRGKARIIPEGEGT